MSNVHEVVGVVDKILGNNNFSVTFGDEDNTKTILCHLSGKMRQFNINVVPGDEVTVELPPPYDKGRITFRGRKGDQSLKSAKKGKGKKGKRR